MSLKRCKNGHFFDPKKHTFCPHCGVSSLKVGKTQPLGGDKTPTSPKAGATKMRGSASNGTSPAKRQKASASEEEVVTRRHGGKHEKGKKDEKEGVTMVKMRESTGIDPVVGWLVSVEGPDKGRDYRIRTERNFIGRKDNNDIVIKGDDSISREKHAIISFNPRKRSFRLAPGDSRGLIYHNDEEVLTPLELQAYDVLEIGKTKLMFIPLCGEKFSWDSQKSSKSMEEEN
jgi:hypothetical protein